MVEALPTFRFVAESSCFLLLALFNFFAISAVFKMRRRRHEPSRRIRRNVMRRQSQRPCTGCSSARRRWHSLTPPALPSAWLVGRSPDEFDQSSFHQPLRDRSPLPRWQVAIPPAESGFPTTALPPISWMRGVNAHPARNATGRSRTGEVKAAWRTKVRSPRRQGTNRSSAGGRSLTAWGRKARRVSTTEVPAIWRDGAVPARRCQRVGPRTAHARRTTWQQVR